MSLENAHTSLAPKAVLANFKRPLQIGVAAGVLVGILSIFVPNQYTSEAKLLPASSKKGGGMAGMAAAAAAFGISVGSSDSAAPYVEILKSRWVRERLLNERYTYHQKAWLFGKPKNRQSTLLEAAKARNLDEGCRELAKMINVQKDLKSGVITLTATTKSPDLSQALTRRAVALLEEFLRTQNQTQGGAKAAFVAQRLVEAKASAMGAEQAFRDFLSVNRNYPATPDPSVRLKGARLEAELQLWKQLVASIALSHEQALMEQKDDTPVVNVIDTGNLPIEKSGPKRSMMALLFFFLAGGLSAAWRHRKWIQERLLSESEPHKA